MIDLAKITGFEWDGGNARKNEMHGVSTAEAEQIFFNLISNERQHGSSGEPIDL